jgi:hypothetical protein
LFPIPPVPSLIPPSIPLASSLSLSLYPPSLSVSPQRPSAYYDEVNLSSSSSFPPHVTIPVFEPSHCISPPSSSSSSYGPVLQFSKICVTVTNPLPIHHRVIQAVIDVINAYTNMNIKIEREDATKHILKNVSNTYRAYSILFD